jgi:hypothetical protein
MTGKLKLNPEALAVTSFETAIEATAMRGTVQAREIECNNTDLRSCPLTIRTCASWEFSCRQANEV